jgi:membrane-associated HD superfamily phosphohydrolase
MNLSFWKNPFYSKYLQATLAGLFLALVFSYSSGVQIMFEEGQRWQYDDLYANKTILVPMPTRLIDSLSKNNVSYTPFYTYNKDILPEKLKLFTEDFESAIALAKKDPNSSDVAKYANIYLQFGQQMLSKIYERGVLPDKIAPEKIYINRGNLTIECPSKQIFTIKTAQDFITDSLPYSTLREPQFLLDIFEKKITPNLVFDEIKNASEQNKIRQLLENHRDTIQQGELIIKKGKKITPALFNKLEAYKMQSSGAQFGTKLPIRFIIFALFSVFCCLVLAIHSALYRPEYLRSSNTWFTILGIIILLNLMHFIVLYQNNLHPLLTPFLALPMLLRRRLDRHYVAVAHVICVVVASQITTVPFSFVVAMLMSGFFMIYAKYFDQKPFGKIYLTLSSLSILAFVFYTLSFQQNIIFDPFNILIFILLHGFLVLLMVFLERFILKEEKEVL